MEQILSMIGLAKKAGRVEIGEEPVGAAARAKHARVILVAGDAAASSVRRAYSFAQAGACLCLTIDATKDDLGWALGRTSCAMAAVTDIGFAEAIVKKLAAKDAARYGSAAEQLSIKAKRAAERKREQLQHEKNIQQGKKRKSAEKEQSAPAVTKSAETAAEGSAKKPALRKNIRRKSAASKSTDRFAGSRPVKKGKGSFKK
ncbi:MAG: 50S ribosomal protein L7 [Oscillospiraceae bacterium]|nr:50S ribosomal protein L7 [Oscillospiraceae bacterium]